MRLFVCAAMVALVGLPQSAPPVAVRVSAEARRVAEMASAAPADQRAAVEARSSRARTAADAGREYFALYELEPAYELAAASRFAAAQKDVTTVDAITTLWQRSGEPKLPGKAGAARPLVADAIVQAASARSPATYRASLPYAKDAGVDAGLYYLGESRAIADFAAFVQSLPWPRPAAPRTLRSVAPELDAFDREVTRAYERMTPAEHRAYILTSDALKEARALDDRGAYAGALLQYLVARVRFAQVRPVATTADARATFAAARAQSRGSDNSILELFLQLGETAADAGDAPGANTAAAIAGDVIPAYRAATAPSSTAAAAPAAASPVTITLVRWPFT
jgi:hypothetical protein